jgi:hypothetical protein
VPGVAFEQFAQAVSRIPDRLRDRHIASQAPLHAAVVAAPHHFVVRHENLDSDWVELSRLTGLPPMPRFNRSTTGSAKRAVDPVVNALVARTYAEDYRRLEYLVPC